MVPKIDFGLHIVPGEILQCVCVFCGFVFTIQMALLFSINIQTEYFDCKTKLCLIVPGRQGKYIFRQECFYLQGLLKDINEQDTSFLY